MKERKKENSQILASWLVDAGLGYFVHPYLREE
jgi:hypothetical protein